MKKIAVLIPTIIIAITLVFTSCEKEDCPDCGGTIAQGFIFRTVTEEDLTSLGDIPDIKLEACMRFKLAGGDIDENTVKIVDDCCCD